MAFPSPKSAPWHGIPPAPRRCLWPPSLETAVVSKRIKERISKTGMPKTPPLPSAWTSSSPTMGRDAPPKRRSVFCVYWVRGSNGFNPLVNVTTMATQTVPMPTESPNSPWNIGQPCAIASYRCNKNYPKTSLKGAKTTTAKKTKTMTTMTTTKRKKKMEMPRERPSDLVVIAMMARARMTRRMIKLRRKTQKRTMAAKARRRNAPKSAFLTKKPRLVTMTTRTTTCRMEHTKIQMTWFASTTQRKISGRSTEMKRRKQSLLNKIVVGSVPGGGWEVWEGWMEGKMMIIVMLLVLPGSWRRGTGWKEG
mmetsp:Transcript_24373/g.50014  ORF Transcript_24373/g.50014 Transcript_24373/m.50014 type:complete len:308 (+) Transcript_24373:532-1455(+)